MQQLNKDELIKQFNKVFHTMDERNQLVTMSTLPMEALPAGCDPFNTIYTMPLTYQFYDGFYYFASLSADLHRISLGVHVWTVRDTSLEICHEGQHYLPRFIMVTADTIDECCVLLINRLKDEARELLDCNKLVINFLAGHLWELFERRMKLLLRD